MTGLAPVLVTGFEPFDGATINASWEAVSLLPEAIAGHRVEKHRLPVEFGRSAELLVETMRALQPAAVIAVGEARGRTELCVERVAVNVMQARIPDNAGFQPDGDPVVADGPAQYATMLPVDACVAASCVAGMPACASDSAGRYVCNQLMYRLLHECACQEQHIPVGFIHVPCLPSQEGEQSKLPCYPAKTLAQGLQAVIATCLC